MQKLFEYPGLLPSLNQVIEGSKRHFSLYSKEKKFHTLQIGLICRATRIKLKGRSSLLFVWHRRHKRRDPDNVASGIKYLLDGMVAGGMLRNDSAEFVGDFTHKFVYGGFDKVEVYLIEEITMQ